MTLGQEDLLLGGRVATLGLGYGRCQRRGAIQQVFAALQGQVGEDVDVVEKAELGGQLADGCGQVLAKATDGPVTIVVIHLILTSHLASNLLQTLEYGLSKVVQGSGVQIFGVELLGSRPTAGPGCLLNHRQHDAQ